MLEKLIFLGFVNGIQINELGVVLQFRNMLVVVQRKLKRRFGWNDFAAQVSEMLISFAFQS